MEFKWPTIFHLAYSSVNYQELEWYLAHLGAPDWKTDAKSDAEHLIEVAGRRCYKSFGTGLNPNITRVREGNAVYIGNILATKHGSVLEHAYDTFAIEGLSRVCTHELVRHRICNFSQESMRFVRPTELAAIFPQVYTDHLDADKQDKVKTLFKQAFESAEEIQQQLIDIIGIDDPGMPFALKKMFQSANRRLIPDGMSTGIIVTANHRTWRFITALRTDAAAEEEIRYIFYRIFCVLKGCYPAIYQDSDTKGYSRIYDIDVPAVTYANHKV